MYGNITLVLSNICSILNPKNIVAPEMFFENLWKIYFFYMAAILFLNFIRKISLSISLSISIFY